MRISDWSSDVCSSDLLWTQEKPEFEGKYVSFRDVGYEPKPQNLPLWFGGDAEAPLKRIAKWEDVWSPFLTPPEKFPEALDFIHSQPDYHGRPIELFFPIEAMKLGEGHAENTADSEPIRLDEHTNELQSPMR